MGNTSSSSGHKPLVNQSEPLTFHSTHSENIQLFDNGRIARRVESFCKGICFSARPIKVGEEVSIKCEEISTNWSGFLRVGFTSHNPALISPHTLPRYACPDMTNQPGNWAKALPERFGIVGHVITYHVNRQGDVHIMLNGESLPGPFFCGVNVASPIWALIDIYGNAKGVEFVDNMVTRALLPARVRSPSDRSMSSRSRKNTASSITPPTSIPINSPSKHHPRVNFLPLFLHQTSGRCVKINSERTVATRHEAEYANAYVFCERPMRPNEKVVIQVLAMDTSYSGGLTVGVTSCNPSAIGFQELPDDSDQLLDRPEYWIVHKDVVTSAEVGDELSFTMSNDGEILFNRNTNPPVVIMHVDKTVDMWMFWDLYGQFNRIKLFGVIGASRSEARSPPVHPRLAKASELRADNHSDNITSALASALTVELPSAIDAPPVPPRLQRSATLGGATSSPSFQPEASERSTVPVEVDETADNLANECTVCFDKPCDCVIYTCGHMCMCYQCALSLKASSDPLCPICRQDIKDIIRIFKS